MQIRIQVKLKKAAVWIRICFNADPAFLVNEDPNLGFDDQKL